MCKSSYFIFLSIIHLILIYHHSNVDCATVKCEYNFYNWTDGESSLYTCVVQNNTIFDGSRVIIDAIEGDHISGKNNHDVKAIRIKYNANLSIFPQGFANHFDNINTVYVYSSNLQEISQSDLQPFPKLTYLYLNSNEMKMIDKNLFLYNPELKTIKIHDNKISHIDPSTFDSLMNLSVLRLDGNKCEKSFEYTKNRSDVEKVIERINAGECISPDIVVDKYKMYLLQLKVKNITNLDDYIESHHALTTKVDKISNEKENLAKSVKEIEIQRDNLNIKLNESDEQVQKAVNDQRKANEELINIKLNLNDLRGNNENLKLELSESEKAKQIIENAKNVASSQVILLNKNVSDLQAQRDNLQAKYDETETTAILIIAGCVLIIGTLTILIIFLLCKLRASRVYNVVNSVDVLMCDDVKMKRIR